MELTKKQYKLLSEVFDLGIEELLWNGEYKKVEKACLLWGELKGAVK
jgi:hypothetical protein